MNRKTIKLWPLCLAVFALQTVSCTKKAQVAWPEQHRESKPGVRWWWLGNAVDKENLTGNMEALSEAGIGAVEITPIYGIQGAEDRHIEYLSPQWMEMYKHVVQEGNRLDMEIGMTTGTGWPFGGPDVQPADAATKVVFQQYELKGGTGLKETIEVKDEKQKAEASLATVVAYSSKGDKIELTSFLNDKGILDWEAPAGADWTIWAVFNGKTRQQVKRAAPGGKGRVLNHYSAEALRRYLKKYDDAFGASGATFPHTFFNDSYEVYGANWSENLLTAFEASRGYRLQDYIPELNRIGDPDSCARVITDYRETIAELLLHEFTIPWTEWAHSHGSITRNQAHGSPGNLIDYYAAVDIPECESFGRTRFDIPGLRVDSGMKESDSHPSSLKYASSAAHITGKKYTSSETFTWLTEHFRTSLSQMKPELDLMFLSGVNHMFYHGSTYSPKDAAWPGWMFYATVNLNPNNTIFQDIKGLNEYITRSQSFLQDGEPDNDFLLYVPIYDIWQRQDGLYLMFDIHKMQQRMPDFFDMVVNIQRYGYDTDYISDKYLLQTRVENGLLKTPGASYKAIIVPNINYIPVGSLEKLLQLAREGATLIFTDQLPKDVPGLHAYQQRQEQLQELLSGLSFSSGIQAVESIAFGKGKIVLGKDHVKVLEETSARPEALSSKYGAGILRRKHEQGHHYFVAMLDNKPIDAYVSLSVDFRSAMIYNPLTGESGKALVRELDGKQEMYLQLEPGQSLIIKTYDRELPGNTATYTYQKKAQAIELLGDWSFRFTEGWPGIDGTFNMNPSPTCWTALTDSAEVYAGTGRYTHSFDLPAATADDWMLDLGDLRESAKVYVNGEFAGIVWSLPYTLRIGKYLKEGKNTLEIDVTNLPANRIRMYDREGIKWRIFEDINVVSVFYKDIRFDSWAVSPSGLTSPVSLIPMTRQQ